MAVYYFWTVAKRDLRLRRLNFLFLFMGRKTSFKFPTADKAGERNGTILLRSKELRLYNKAMYSVFKIRDAMENNL